MRHEELFGIFLFDPHPLSLSKMPTYVSCCDHKKNPFETHVTFRMETRVDAVPISWKDKLHPGEVRPRLRHILNHSSVASGKLQKREATWAGAVPGWTGGLRAWRGRAVGEMGDGGRALWAWPGQGGLRPLQGGVCPSCRTRTQNCRLQSHLCTGASRHQGSTAWPACWVQLMRGPQESGGLQEVILHWCLLLALDIRTRHLQAVLFLGEETSGTRLIIHLRCQDEEVREDPLPPFPSTTGCGPLKRGWGVILKAPVPEGS